MAASSESNHKMVVTPEFSVSSKMATSPETTKLMDLWQRRFVANLADTSLVSVQVAGIPSLSVPNLAVQPQGSSIVYLCQCSSSL